jgi:hypothetical protein
MATGDSTDTASTITERLAVDHRHPVGTTALVAGFALLLGWYVSWLLADFGLRIPALLLLPALTGYGLYRRPDRAAVATAGLGSLAVALAVTPVLLNLSFLLSAGQYGVSNPWPFVLKGADLVVFGAFLLLGAVPAVSAALVRYRWG